MNPADMIMNADDVGDSDGDNDDIDDGDVDVGVMKDEHVAERDVDVGVRIMDGYVDIGVMIVMMANDG